MFFVTTNEAYDSVYEFLLHCKCGYMVKLSWRYEVYIQNVSNKNKGFVPSTNEQLTFNWPLPHLQKFSHSSNTFTFTLDILTSALSLQVLDCEPGLFVRHAVSKVRLLGVLGVRREALEGVVGRGSMIGA